MRLTRLRLSNFKTFRDAEIRFGGLTVLIGWNASGRTNVVNAIRFLRDLASRGLEDPLACKGNQSTWRTSGSG